MKYLIIILALGFILLIPTVPLYAQGKSAQAPGQIKKLNAVIGTVDNVSTNSITVREKTGNNKTEVMVDKSTKIFDYVKKEINLGAIKLKDTVAFIATDSGTATASGNAKVGKIFVKDASMTAQLKRRAVQGVIADIAGNVLILQHQIQRDKTYTVTVNDQTMIKLKSTSASASANSATVSASFSSLAVGQRIAAVGDLNPDGGIVAKIVHVIPGKATGIFKKNPVATPSATLKASPSGSASASPKSTPSASASAIPGV